MVQLSLVLAASNRRFILNYESNGACVAINNVTLETQLTFDFHNVCQTTIPLIVFQYLDFLKFKNLPNFDDFANYTYLKNKKFIKTDQKSKLVKFDLQLVNNGVKTFPETFFNKTITQDQIVKYNVSEPGVYCIYLPMYSFDNKRTHFTPYYTFVTVENEGMKENVLTEVSTQINSFIIVASVIFILIYVYPILRTGRRISKLSSVSNQLFQFLLTNNVYYCGYLILWAIYFVFPTDAMYYFIVNYYGSFLQVVLKYWLSYITLSVYFGSGYANLPINPPQFLLKLYVGINILATFISFQLLKDALGVEEIIVNSESYQIIDKSILVNKKYKTMVTAYLLYWEKIVVTVLAYTKLTISALVHLVSFGYGLKLYWNLKKSNNNRVTRPLLQSIVLHLVSWRIIGRIIIANFYSDINLTGVFDVGEMLSVIGNLIELQDLKFTALRLVEVLLLWFIWSFNKPLDFKKTKRDDKKKEKKRKESKNY